MKLDIQRFSGGSYDYKFSMIDEYYCGKMYDMELNDLMQDIVKLTHDLEWWKSCDYNEEDYRQTVRKFKNKWFKSSRNDRLKEYIDNRFDETRKELLELIDEKQMIK